MTLIYQKMDSTLQENDFIGDNLDQILQILKRDTDTTNNQTLTSNTLHHIYNIITYRMYPL